ncbi:MAG TPA: SPOR domain-containing protein [Gemmatimonadales bacterium]|nr:SPOR domain-containing protein [Gemmatimonadales bacterium]
MTRSIAVRVACAFGLLLACPAACLSAQSEPRLAGAVRLAQEGLGDSARAVVQGVLDATPPGDTLYPQILYAAAAVAGDPDVMRSDLRRIAIEYAYSGWADDALLRLAQLDFADGNRQGAIKSLEQIRLDYPGSPLFATAALWAGRAYFDENEPRSACSWLDDGLARLGDDDVELRNRLDFYHQRCANLAPAGLAGADSSRAAGTGADSTRPDLTKPDSTRPAPVRSDSTATVPASARFRIQIAAVATQAMADAVASRAKAGGYDPVVAREKGLLKVRLGAYQSRAAAAADLAAVQAKFGGKPFVVAGP